MPDKTNNETTTVLNDDEKLLEFISDRVSGLSEDQIKQTLIMARELLGISLSHVEKLFENAQLAEALWGIQEGLDDIGELTRINRAPPKPDNTFVSSSDLVSKEARDKFSDIAAAAGQITEKLKNEGPTEK